MIGSFIWECRRRIPLKQLGLWNVNVVNALVALLPTERDIVGSESGGVTSCSCAVHSSSFRIRVAGASHDIFRTLCISSLPEAHSLVV